MKTVAYIILEFLKLVSRVCGMYGSFEHEILYARLIHVRDPTMSTRHRRYQHRT